MLQPFEHFKAIYIPKLLEMEKLFLVSQTYTRHNSPFDTDAKKSLLLTDYADENLAKTHREALSKDKYAVILDLRQPKHKARLLDLLGETSRFHVFWAVVKNVKELEARINALYKPRMKDFIDKNTNWRISRDTILHPSVELVFGQLYITLQYGRQTIRVKFEDIESV